MMSVSDPFSLKPVDPNKDLPAFLIDDHMAALSAFQQMNARPQGYSHKTGALNIKAADLLSLARDALSTNAEKNPRAFFSDNFCFFNLIPAYTGAGLLTGFFEPLVEASATRSEAFPIPILGVPDDLVSVRPHEGGQLLDGYRFARRLEDGKLTIYFNRQQIETGALKNKAQPIAFVRDKVTAFFIHIQGAACLQMDDGSRCRITFAAKSGHPFTAIGKVLVERGAIAPDAVSMQSIKAWLYAHPEQADAIMWLNQSYIFFRQVPYVVDHPGPIAAAKVPLSKGRSIAVDRDIHTFGTPFFIQAEKVNAMPFARTMIAQDTGSAIVGAARADLFFGTGTQAGEEAGAVKTYGRFTIMVPKQSVAGLTVPIISKSL